MRRNYYALYDSACWKNASYDGSTMMARNEDSPSGSFTPKKFIVLNPKDQPRKYQSVLTKFHMDLPGEPLRYTAMPNALPEEGFGARQASMRPMWPCRKPRPSPPMTGCWGRIPS